MIVKQVEYTSNYIKQFKLLPADLQKIATKKDLLFRSNPLHPSLRLHSLKGNLEGLWSISITAGYRALFQRLEHGDILFISIGKHDIYKNL